MPEEVTNAELARRLDYLRGDVREDLKAIKEQLSHLVPREVYDAQRAETERRVGTLELAEKARVEQRRADVRWLIAAVALPIFVLIVNILLSVKGVKP